MTRDDIHLSNTILRHTRRHGRKLLAAVATAALVAAGCLDAAPAQALPGQTVVSVAAGTTADALVHQLIGDGTPYSNVKITGSNDSIGLFGGFTTLGAASGVVLATGHVNETSSPLSQDGSSAVVAPNLAGETSGDMGTPGDPDLDAIVASIGSTHSTLDAVSLEFDFVPTTSTLTFSYIFGSEEYLEYVNKGYSDVFGLFVNGVNCAVVGPGNDPVTVDTINPSLNSAYYRDNPVGAATIDTGFDGVTTVLTCEVNVNAGQTNHVKFAIADTWDTVYDSGVFIVGKSFLTRLPADPKKSTITSAPPTAPADDTSTITVTVKLFDSTGAPVTTGGDTVTITSSLGSVGTVTDNGDGTYTALVKSGVAGPATFGYTVNGVAASGTASGTFVDASPSPSPTQSSQPPTSQPPTQAAKPPAQPTKPSVLVGTGGSVTTGPGGLLAGGALVIVGLSLAVAWRRKNSSVA